MRVHIVGAGLIGRKRAASLEDDDVLVSVTDPQQARVDDLLRDLGGHLGPGIREEDRYPRQGDIAVIATTHDQLVKSAERFAAAGCHILVEKPGARNAAEFTQLRQSISSSQFIAVGYNHRFHPAIQELRQITATGKYGRVLSIRGRYGHGGREGYNTEWRMSRSTSGGGELLDQGSHLIDLTRFLAGDFTLLHAELATLYWDADVEDNAWLIGALPGGGRAALHASWTEWKNLFSLEVFFNTAKAEVCGLGGSYGPETLTICHMESGLGPPSRVTKEFPPGDVSWIREWRDFKSRINQRPSSGATDSDAFAVLEVIGEAYKRAYD